MGWWWGVKSRSDDSREIGRERVFYRNASHPVPIRLVHDRWIGKFAAPIVGAMSILKTSREASMDPIDHVYTVFIKAPPDRVWKAITDGDDTVRYYYGTRVVSDWGVGAGIHYDYPDGSVAADGEVLAIEPGRQVTMTFHPRWSLEIDAEGPVRMTWSVEATDDGGSRLTVTSALVPGSRTAEEFADGIAYIVSGLKTFVETGAPLVPA